MKMRIKTLDEMREYVLNAPSGVIKQSGYDRDIVLMCDGVAYTSEMEEFLPEDRIIDIIVDESGALIWEADSMHDFDIAPWMIEKSEPPIEDESLGQEIINRLDRIEKMLQSATDPEPREYQPGEWDSILKYSEGYYDVK